MCMLMILNLILHFGSGRWLAGIKNGCLHFGRSSAVKSGRVLRVFKALAAWMDTNVWHIVFFDVKQAAGICCYISDDAVWLKYAATT